MPFKDRTRPKGLTAPWFADQFLWPPQTGFTPFPAYDLAFSRFPA